MWTKQKDSKALNKNVSPNWFNLLPNAVVCSILLKPRQTDWQLTT